MRSVKLPRRYLCDGAANDSERRKCEHEVYKVLLGPTIKVYEPRPMVNMPDGHHLPFPLPSNVLPVSMVLLKLHQLFVNLLRKRRLTSEHLHAYG